MEENRLLCEIRGPQNTLSLVEIKNAASPDRSAEAILFHKLQN